MLLTRGEVEGEGVKRRRTREGGRGNKNGSERMRCHYCCSSISSSGYGGGYNGGG